MRFWIVHRPVVIAALLGPLLLIALLLGTAQAQNTGPIAPLDRLFIQLRAAPDAPAARAIADQIWQKWTKPEDPELARRMRVVMGQQVMGHPGAAIEALQAVVKDYPRYAEGWNQLATLHFLMGDYDASLAEIEKVLEFEPRHFGALAGRALIYRSQGKQALAVKDMAAALAIHPFLAEKALFPELLDDVTRI